MSVDDRDHLDESPERERRLHDDRLVAVEAAQTDLVVASQTQHPGRVALLIDRVAAGGGSASSRRVALMPVLVTRVVELFSVHALDSDRTVDEDSERPAPGDVVIDDLGVNVVDSGFENRDFSCVQFVELVMTTER